MKEQQAQSDCDQEQTLDCENTIPELEALRQLNEQLQARIVALENTKTPTQLKSEPGIEECPNIQFLDELV